MIELSNTTKYNIMIKTSTVSCSQNTLKSTCNISCDADKKMNITSSDHSATDVAGSGEGKSEKNKDRMSLFLHSVFPSGCTRTNQSNLKQMYLSAISTVVLLMITFAASAQTAGFTATPMQACSPTNVNFTDNSSGATSWLWDFGNSNTSTVQNPSANYPQPGTYTVTLTINGGGGPQLIATKNIKVYPHPNPSVPTVINNCEPYTGSLTVVSAPVVVAPFMIGSSSVGGITGGAVTSYTFNFFGALPTVTQASPVLNLTNVPAGIYDLLLTTSDDNGCSTTIYKQGAITINPKPTADFTYVKASLCGTGDVTFSGTASVGSGTITGYAWDIGNNGTIESTSQNFTYNFASAGTYDVSFVVTTDNLCASTPVIKQVIFNSNNTIGFSFSGNCAGQSVAFTNTSGATAVSYAWDFDNNGTTESTLQNPTFVYNAVGAYTAKLTVTYSDGCIMSTTQPVTISGGTSSFTYSTSTSCAPNYTIGFTSTAVASGLTTITGYAWDFDNNGSTDAIVANPSYSFNAPGTYPVRFTITTSAGCSITILSDVVIPATVVDFSATPLLGCVPLVSAFTSIYANPSDPITSYSWNFGDPGSGANNTSVLANPSHSYAVAGKYTVSLTVTTSNGCTLTQTKIEYIAAGSPQPISNVTYTQATLCKSSSVNLTATITALTNQVIWNFNDGTPNVTQNVSGQTSTSVSHNFATPGVHTVTAQAWYNGCPSAVYTVNNITINEPSAAFTVPTNVYCTAPTAAIAFTNTSVSIPANSIYSWNFGDGQTSALQSPSHVYAAAGNYTVTLTVNNTVTGCSDVATSSIYVTTSTPLFTINNPIVCGGTASTFTNQVAANSSPNFNAASYLWTFGDGQTSALANPSHTYSVPGLYTVTLEVTEARGCVYSYSQTNLMDVRGPIVNFTSTPAQICAGASVTFTNTSTKAANDPATSNTYLWTFGDGNTSTTENTTNTYIGTGSYNVTLQVTDNNGCSASKTEPGNIVVPPVTAGFNTTRAIYCADAVTPVSFTNSAVGTIAQYDWDLDGDGTYEVINGAASQSRTFPLTGVFNIKQRITSNLGCIDIYTKDITIVDATAGIYIADTDLGCAPGLGQFQSTDPGSVVSSYLWNFGDGKTSTSQNPNHFFIMPGIYTVNLTLTLTGGCTRTSSIVITVDGPIGTFSYDNTPGCAPHTETFNAINLLGVSQLTWDFGDGVTVVQPIPVGVTTANTTHTYTTWGSRLPILILYNSECGDYAYYYGVNQRINTSEAPIPAFSFVTISGENCQNSAVQFTDQSTKVDPRYPISTWDWDFGDGTAHSSLQNPIHTYANPGTYTATLIVGNGLISGGCNSTISHNVIVNPLPTVTATNQVQTICSGSSSTAMVLSGTVLGTTFGWTRTTPAGITTLQPVSGSGIAIGGNIPGNLFSNSTNAPITVTYTITPTGPAPTFCLGSAITATVTVSPIPTVTSAVTKTICNNLSVAYTPTSLVASTTYTWTGTLTTGTVTGITAIGSGNIADVLNNTGTAVATVTYVITPTGPAPTFCVGLPVSLVVTVRPTPNVTALPSPQDICSGTAVNVTLSTTVPGTTFWYPAPIVTGSIAGGAARATPGNTNPINDLLTQLTAAIQTATYTITPIINGCSGTAVPLIVNVNPKPVLTSGLTQNLCADATGVTMAASRTLTTTPVMANATFSWGAPVMTGGMIINTNGGLGTSITDSYNLNGSSQVQTATYSVTPTAPALLGGCVGAAVSVVITVNPKPILTPGLAQTLCSGVAANLALTTTPVTPGTLYTYPAPINTGGMTGGAARVTASAANILSTFTNTTGSIQTATYTVTPQINGCPGDPVSVVITVKPAPVVISTPAAETICNGSPTNLTLSSNVALTTYTWVASLQSGTAAGFSNCAAACANPIAQTLTNATNNIATVRYRIIGTADGCASANKDVIETVRPTPSATISGTTTVCLGGAAPLVTFTNPRSLPITVTYNINGGGNTTINVGLSTTVAAPTGAAGTFVYNLVSVVYQTVPNCSNALAGSATITVQSAVTAGSIAADQTICNGGDPATFSSSTDGAGSGTIAYRWEKSVSPFSIWNTIAGQTASTYDAPSGLAATTQYRRITISTVGGVPCESLPTAFITVTVQSTPASGTIAANQTICNGGDPAAFTSTTAGTGSGTISYRWENSVSPFSVWNTIAGQTGATYDVPSGLAVTTEYRRITISTLNSVACESVPAAFVTVTVQSTPTAGAIAADQTICNGGNPAAFTSTSAGTGSGAITYRWEKSVSPFITWTTIAGQTASTYDAPTGLAATTRYRRITISTAGGVPCESIPAAFVTVTVQSAPAAGAIAANQAICSGGDPLAFTSTTPGSGSGIISYRWESSVSPFSVWNTIAGQIGDTYDIPSGLAATTEYRRIAISTLNSVACESVPAAFITVTVNPLPAAPTIGTVVQPTCTVSTGTITVTAPTGAGITYSIDGSDYTNTTGIFTNISEGVYTVTAKSALGCISPGTIVTIAKVCLTVTKTQTGGPATVTAAGQLLTYSIVITNTGTTSLTGVVPTETYPGAGAGTLSAKTESISTNNILNVGETWTYTATYTTTQADVDAGLPLVNTISVVTTEVSGPTVDTESTPVSGSKSLTVVKTQTLGSNPVTAAGQLLTYSIVITNTGTTSLTGVVAVAIVGPGTSMVTTLTVFTRSGPA